LTRKGDSQERKNRYEHLRKNVRGKKKSSKKRRRPALGRHNA